MVDTQRETTEKMSREFGLQTRYLRTICTGRLKANEDREDMTDALSTVSAKSRRFVTFQDKQVEGPHAARIEALMKETVFSVLDGDTVELYAWLLPQDFEYLASSAGTPVLEK